MWEPMKECTATEEALELRDSISSCSLSDTRALNDSTITLTDEMDHHGLHFQSQQSFSLRFIQYFGLKLLALLRFMIPSFLQEEDLKDKNASPPKRNEAHAALDGLRGLACLIVAWYHYFGYSYEVTYGYYWDNEKADGGWAASKWSLPVVKIVLAGPNMVAIFFVISGYVLTHRFLSLIRQGKPESALMSMSSAIFRRFMRLYAPVFVFTLMLQAILQLNLFEHGRDRFDGKPYPPRGETIWQQCLLFWTWWREAVNPFTFDPHYPDQFDGNIWTIPIEYRCSMVLFLVAIGLARVKTMLRIALIIVVMGWAMNAVRWEVILFLLGLLIAQVDVLLEAKITKGISLEKMEEPNKFNQQWLWYPTMFAAIYLCSIPWHHDGAWGWTFLSNIDPFPGEFIFSTWQVVGAVLMVVCALYWRPFQMFLNCAPIQYLGHVSYALYLVHGSLVKLATYSLKFDIFDVLNDYFHPADVEPIHCVSVWISFVLFFMPSLIVFADMFWRGIDQPIVELSRKLWDYCTR